MAAANKFDIIWRFLSENEIKFDIPVQSNLTCMLCNHILINAKQSPCGCRFCLNCIAHYLDGGVKQCPGQSEYCTDYMIDLNNILPDNSANREISKLVIQCPNDNCEVENELRFIIDHLPICDYTLTNCLQCNLSLLIKDAEYHNTTECEHRTSQCQFCNEIFDHKILIEQHCNIEYDAFCDKLIALCPNGCQETNPIRLKQHLLICSNRPEPCLYKSLGCQLIINRNTVNNHLAVNNTYHSKMLLNHIDNLQNEIFALKQEDKIKSQEINELKLKIIQLQAHVEPKHNDFIWKIEGFPRIKTEFVTSKPFLTSRFGYKMCLKLWTCSVLPLNNYRTIAPLNNTRWVSLFCLLMNGTYDELLPRQFPYDIKVSLVGPGGTDQHTQFIRAGSIDREFGLTRFIEYDKLVSDCSLLFDSDAIYIRCTVG